MKVKAVKKKLLSHIKKDSKEFKGQLKEDVELKKYIKKNLKKAKKKNGED